MDFGSQRIHRISITDEVIQRLSEQICRGGIGVGDKLPTEGELQKSLGVGRSTVREALRVLQAMGLVEMKSGLGAFVKSTRESSEASIEDWMVKNEKLYIDLMELRTGIEEQAVILAIERASREQIEIIAQVHLEFTKACSERNAIRVAKLDEEFHDAIFGATGNFYLIRFGRIMAQSLGEFRIHSFTHEKFVLNALAPHGEILAAIRERDTQFAIAAMRRHLKVSLEDLEYARSVREGKAAT